MLHVTPCSTLLELLARVLIALARMRYQSSHGTASPDCHQHRIRHQLRGHLRTHRPAHDPTGKQIDHRSNIEPALG
jgi:hypothetical protein